MKKRASFTHEKVVEPLIDGIQRRFNCFIEYDAFPQDNELLISDFSAQDEQGEEVTDLRLIRLIRAHLEIYTCLQHASLMERAV